MTTLRIDTAPVFEPLLQPARYRAAWGGRGSGKSHFFAELLVEECLLNPGMRAICIREVQKSLKESAKRLIEDKLSQFNLGEKQGFRVLVDRIETPGGGLIGFQGMQDHTAESVKSLENYKVAWVEEAQTLSARSLGLLRPTIRAEGSELWFSWNPTRKSDPVDLMLRGPELPTNATVIKANWSDNPWFPSVLEQERLDCLRSQPDAYEHIWEGGYAKAMSSAYYAKCLAETRLQGRIGKVQPDPLMQARAFWDIGFNDSTAIWIAQFIGKEIRILDYYEAQGQPLSSHLLWLRTRGWGNCLCILPHDGAHHSNITGLRFEDHIRQAGFKAETVGNQGKGAAMLRIEAARRLFPSMWFNEETCSTGIELLGYYHEKKHPVTGAGLGPNHNDEANSSHAADAFGLMAVAYEAPREKTKPRERAHVGGASWMQ